MFWIGSILNESTSTFYCNGILTFTNLLAKEQVYVITNFFNLLQMFEAADHSVRAVYKASVVFARSNTGTVGSNPTQGMDICVCFYSVTVLFCV
jgi:hypothetical protein